MKQWKISARGLTATFAFVALIALVGCSQAPAPTAEPQRQAPPPVEKTAGELEEEAVARWEALKAETTREQRLEEWGVSNDPGLNPDPETIWYRFDKPFRIEKFEKRYAIFRDTPTGWVRPVKGVSFAGEIYRDDENWIWVWIPIREDDLEEQAVEYDTDPERYHLRNLSDDVKRSLLELRSEFYTLTPPGTDELVRFVESSDGLPQQGSWRNSLDVADMNGDGFPDLIVPPERGAGFGGQRPSIFLGDGKGGWTFWRGLKWPNVTVQYGSARVADFNGDGQLDIAIASHLRGPLVFLRDGDGFVNSSRGLPETDFPTRRLEVADVDADGDPDLIVLTEGPTVAIRKDEPRAVEREKMRIYRNHKNGSLWQEYRIGEVGRQFGGDWLAVGQFNDDQYPDFLASSIYFHGTDVFWISDGEMTWEPFGRGFFPWHSYIGDVAAARVVSRDHDDGIVSFTRFWPQAVNPAEIEHPEVLWISGIEIVTVGAAEPQRIPVVHWESKRATWAMAAGDINGDGHVDIALNRTDPQINEILLGDGEGNFRRARVEGWPVANNTAYELTLADVDLDGRLDLIVMYENSGEILNIKDGSIRVYLNRTGEE